MKILSFRTIYGPNVYHHEPVMIMTLDLEDLAETPSNKIAHFIDNLVDFLPGLREHTCSPGYIGGFVERLHRGTYMGHIIEHVALELSELAGIGAKYGKTRYTGKPGQYRVVTRFINENGMKACLTHAVDLVLDAVFSKKFDVKKVIDEIKNEINKDQLGPSTEAILKAAEKRNIPYKRIQGSLFQLGYGKKSQRIQTAVTDKTSLISADIAQDKDLTKKILQENFIPIPSGTIINSEKELIEALEFLNPPYVIKPYNCNHGDGVSLNLESLNDVLNAFKIATEFSNSVIIEEMCQGYDYRVLIINGLMVAAAQRFPPTVIGTGTDTIGQLIETLNADPRRGEGHETPLTRIEIDNILFNTLKSQNLTLKSIPQKNRCVILRKNANLSSGGSAIDVTNKVHPEIKNLCERAARAVGLDICGVDLIHQDISLPVENKAKIIEVNAGPGLRMHSSSVGDDIINMLYPSEDSGRIPIISVTGTNGKTTVVRMLHKILSQNIDRCVGMTTTDGIWIGSEKIYSGDTTGPKSGQVVLSDTKVDAAVLEVARGGLLRGGLAYDWSDVSVITNIQADHIGQDGIEDVDDLIWIKSVVAERVREHGTLVLNADNPAALRLRDHPRVKRLSHHIFLYSTSAQNPDIKVHIAQDQSACWVDSGYIHIKHKNLAGRLIKVADLPASVNGLAEFQVSNILAAFSAALAAGSEPSQIIKGLQNFVSYKENLGRLNLYKIKQGYVIIDYGHNKDALQAVGKILKSLKGYSKTAILGLPGDRSDELIEDAARAVSKYFDSFILREDQDLRGRKSGEVSMMLQNSIGNQNSKAKCKIIKEESEALDYALKNMKPNEIITLFYENFETVLEILKASGAEPVTQIPEILSSPLDVDHYQYLADWHAIR